MNEEKTVPVTYLGDVCAAIEQAAGELPLGAIIQISVENGSAYIEAQNVDYECFEYDDADASLAEQFMLALDWCKRTSER